MDRRVKKMLMARLEYDAQCICARFRLSYKVLEPERANVKRRYGVCFSDGTIRIRLIHVTTRRPLKYSSLVSTLCHELAHLRHFNHGPRFQAFYAQILEWARREGIYQPGRERKQAPAVSSRPAPVAQPSLLGAHVANRAPRPKRKPRAEPNTEPTRAPNPQLELFG